MYKKSVLVMMLALLGVFCLVSLAAAKDAKLLCVTKQDLRGEETVSSCLAKGEEFAIVDQYGVVRILSPREVELTKAFNPQLFEQRAFGMRYSREAPPMKIFGTVPVQKK